ncbi:MAG: hypothetical protein AAB608_00075 [Patescibacteria group bacterium]
MLFMLGVIGAAVFCLGGLIRGLARNWRNLPNFVCNKVGGVTAYCSVEDFRAGKRIPGDMVVAPGTISFIEKPWSGMPCAAYLMNASPWPFFYGDAKNEPQLFVPFASERHMPFKAQASVFSFAPKTLEELEKMIRDKRERNTRNDARFRLLKFERKFDEEIFTTRLVAFFLVLVVIAVGSLRGLDRWEKERLAAPAAFYTTTAGSSELTEHRGTEGDLRKLIVYGGINDTIVAGPVTDIMALGGGLSYVCVRVGSPERRECGFGGLETVAQKIGQTAYIRKSLGKNWFVPNSPEGYSDSVSWLITKPEARALAAKGYALKE